VNRRNTITQLQPLQFHRIQSAALPTEAVCNDSSEVKKVSRQALLLLGPLKCACYLRSLHWVDLGYGHLLAATAPSRALWPLKLMVEEVMNKRSCRGITAGRIAIKGLDADHPLAPDFSIRPALHCNLILRVKPG